MKTLIILSVFVLSTSIYAQLGASFGTIAKGTCYIQASNMKDFLKATRGLTTKDIIVGGVRNTLIGELDPYALGDGGLIAVDTTQGTHLVHEANELAPIISAIEQNAKNGLKIIAISKGCLSIIKAKNKSEIMKNLAERVMRAKGPFSYLKLN